MDQRCYDLPTKEIVQAYIDAHPEETISLSYKGKHGKVVKIAFGKRKGGEIYEMNGRDVIFRYFSTRETLLKEHNRGQQVDLNAVSLVRVLGWTASSLGCSVDSTKVRPEQILRRLRETGITAVSLSITTSHEQYQRAEEAEEAEENEDKDIYARQYLLEALGGYIVLQDIEFQPALQYAKAIENNPRIYTSPESLVRKEDVPPKAAVRAANDLHELASQYIRLYEPPALDEAELVAHLEKLLLEPHKQPVKQRRVPSYD